MRNIFVEMPNGKIEQVGTARVFEEFWIIESFARNTICCKRGELKKTINSINPNWKVA